MKQALYFISKKCLKLTQLSSFLTALVFVQPLMINWTFAVVLVDLPWQDGTPPQPPARVFAEKEETILRISQVASGEIQRGDLMQTRAEASSWPQRWNFSHQRCVTERGITP